MLNVVDAVIREIERMNFKRVLVFGAYFTLKIEYTTYVHCETCGSMVPVDDPINFIADMADMGIIMDDAFNRCENAQKNISPGKRNTAKA